MPSDMDLPVRLSRAHKKRQQIRWNFRASVSIIPYISEKPNHTTTAVHVKLRNRETYRSRHRKLRNEEASVVITHVLLVKAAVGRVPPFLHRI